MVSGSILEKLTVSPRSGWLAHEKACLIGSSMIYHGPIFFPKMPKDCKDVTIGEG